MITIKIEGGADLYATIDGMIQKLDHFKRVDIGDELSAWQTEDMHRHRPFTMRSRRAGRATTKVRPHSLYEVKRSALAQRRVFRSIRKQLGKMVTYIPHFLRWSRRPILRTELYDRLCTRMGDLLQEKIKW